MADLDKEEMAEVCDEVVELMSVTMDKVIEKGIPKKLAKYVKLIYIALIDEGFTSEQATGIVERMAGTSNGLNMKQS